MMPMIMKMTMKSKNQPSNEPIKKEKRKENLKKIMQERRFGNDASCFLQEITRQRKIAIVHHVFLVTKTHIHTYIHPKSV